MALTHLNVRNKYKSSEMAQYQEAYINTRQKMAKVFKLVQSEHSLFSCPIEDFCCLYFPHEKVVAVAKDKKKAEEMIKL
jgi:hypothetical protein